jgi:hypothetical protein
MRKTERKVVYGGAVLGPAGFISWQYGGPTAGNLVMLTGFVAVIGVLYTLSKKNLLADFKAEQKAESSQFGDAWTEEESRRHLKEWSKRNYTSNNKMVIRWDKAIFKSRPVKIGDEYHKIHCFIFLGDNNRGTQAFVDATGHEIIDHMPMLWEEQLANPFKFCEYYEAEREAQYINSKALDSMAKSGRRTPIDQGMPVDANVQRPEPDEDVIKDVDSD